jgi:hypothetical protein
MTLRFPEVPGWAFEVEETSASVYKVTGSDARGRTVSAVGENIETLLDQCRGHAAEILANSLELPGRDR